MDQDLSRFAAAVRRSGKEADVFDLMGLKLWVIMAEQMNGARVDSILIGPKEFDFEKAELEHHKATYFRGWPSSQVPGVSKAQHVEMLEAQEKYVDWQEGIRKKYGSFQFSDYLVAVHGFVYPRTTRVMPDYSQVDGTVSPISLAGDRAWMRPAEPVVHYTDVVSSLPVCGLLPTSNRPQEGPHVTRTLDRVTCPKCLQS